MIKLEYQYVSPVDENLVSATAEQLHYYYFSGDIVLMANDVDFSTRWGWVPVLDFAVSFTKAVLCLSEEPTSEFEFTESEAVIYLKAEGSQVHLSSNYAEGTAVVEEHELKEVCLASLCKLLIDLQKSNPSLRNNHIFMDYFSEFGLVNNEQT